MPEFVSTLETSDYIAMASAFIALLVFALTLWQGFQVRKHNQLSVKPVLDFCWVNNYENGILCQLVNLGVGPSFLNKISFFVDDIEFHINEKNDYKSLFQELDLNEQLGQVGVQHVQKGSTVSIGQSLDLLNFCDSSVLKNDYEQIAAKLRRLSVQVEYKCIYGICFKSSKSGLL
ncbi:hypothetical protein CXF86_19890 [Shewanella sp. GutCb]|uniref:hypothetical protein n=1 Tax=Shewanella sp. GutCb TaxID=2058315 RepID=UPI000C7CD982|nr:hypothetical protein [Shewanella sp. GutCb]PKG73016.1 hypothetical protein CXF86_19890 [Shewanella sp. GutCb]